MNPGRILLAIAVLAAAGCATAPRGEPSLSDREKNARYESREAVVGAVEHWALDGKLALSGGQDGGSGRLNWRTQPGFSELDFRGTLGRGAWQLDITPELATLDLANGERWQAPEVSSLVVDHLGWSIPVDSLSWWVRGLEAPGSNAERVLDNEGRIETLMQHGWTVDYERYKEFSGVIMPTRLEARNGELTVKLIMRDWTFPVQSEHDS